MAGPAERGRRPRHIDNVLAITAVPMLMVRRELADYFKSDRGAYRDIHQV
jgi:hypothetical protein